MIVVTGASGYVGSHLVKRLMAMGRPVRAMVHNVASAKREGRLEGLDIEMVEADVTRPETLLDPMKGADSIVHTVAIAIEKGRGTYESVNYQGTVNVVDAATAAGVRRFLNLSQLGAAPDLPYRFLASKGRAQVYVAQSELDWTALRPSAIWGPEDEFANTFARLVPFSPIVYPIVGDGKARFQPIWVEDVVTCLIAALDDPETTIGQEYEVGGPEVLTLEEIERRSLEAVGATRWFAHVPVPVLRALVRIMEEVLPSPPVTRSLLELLAVDNVPAENAVHRFVEEPRPFTAENAAPYMRTFKASRTLAQFLGR